MITTFGLSAQQKTTGKLTSLDPAFNELVAPSALIQVLGEGFDWAEGPVWVKEGGFLLFSDVPKNTIYKWKEGKDISTFLNPSGYTGILPYSKEPGSNGLTISNDGQLILCEHGDR
ncbi:MAG: gluconolactonase, partial [Spirosomataceae bacterium]